MQHTPIVDLPKNHHRHDWWLIVTAAVMIFIVVLAAVILARPDFVSTTKEIDRYANPELTQFELFKDVREAAIAKRYANPELTQFELYQGAREAAIAGPYANPELTLFESYQAEHAVAPAEAGPVNPELSAVKRFADARMLIENPEVRQALRWMEAKR